ncbi:autotransporter assembly complex protein TamA [Hydrogenimonas sp.]
MKRVVSLLLFVAFLAAATPLPVRFVGNHAVDARSLYEVLGIPEPLFFEFWKGTPKLDPDKVKALLPGLESYYKSHGYYHARANARIEKGEIVIEIQEGEPIRVEDIATISPLPIDKIVPFEKGAVFDAVAFTKSKEAVIRFYRDHHFCNVQLDAKAFVDIEKNLAYLVYDVTPGKPCHFGEITVHSPPSIDEKIIRSLLCFKEGDPYSSESIRCSYRDIYANEGIERVTIDDSERQGNEVPIVVTVSAYPKPLHFSAGAGYNSDEGINLQAGVTHRNFLGNLKTVGLSARYAQIKRFVRLSAQMPLSHHNRLASFLEARREIFDGYTEEAVSATFTLKHIYHPHYFQESLVFDRIVTTGSNDPVNFPNGTILLISPKVGWEVDRRDSLLDPTRGYRLEVEGMGSLKTLASDATYYKVTASGSFHKPTDYGIASARLKLGSIDVFSGRIPPSYRFYAGGMHSNRAWRYRQLGPKNRNGDPIGAYSVAEGTLEMRIPIDENFRWVLFCDVTWLGQEPWPDFGKAYVGVGPGIRYMSPMGPIGLDVGFDVNDWRQFAIHFHIGELF